MSAEIAKIRYLPLPRWTAIALAAITLLTGLILLIVAPDKPDDYINAPGEVASFMGWVSAMLFGVWLATLDFTAGTMQRTLTAEPDRNRVLVAKLVSTLLVATLIGVAIAAAMGGVVQLTAKHGGVDVVDGDLAAALFGQVPEAIAAGVVGFGFGLLTKSLGGGIAFGIMFVLVLAGMIAFIPGAEDFTYTQATQDLSNGITGYGDTVNGLAAALLVTLAWCAVILAPGWIDYLRSDLK
jgi:ABC-2 type transport system permease protein